MEVLADGQLYRWIVDFEIFELGAKRFAAWVEDTGFHLGAEKCLASRGSRCCRYWA
jgi:hypothetical protein